MSKVGDRIRVLRIKRGLSQEQLADAVGLKRSAIGNYERGTREPDLDTIEAFADFFDISMGDMIGRDEYDPAQEKLKEIGEQLTAPSRSKKWRVMSEGLAEMEITNHALFDATYDYLTAMFPEVFKERNDDDANDTES